MVWSCSVCFVPCRTAYSLASHVLRGKNHREMVYLAAPEQVKELGRLQYFLDTHMKETPIVGLEYIVEKQLEPVEKEEAEYRYICKLCNVERDAYQTFIHVRKPDHIARYIDVEYSSQSVKAEMYKTLALYRAVLKAKASEIHAKCGRKQVQTDSDGRLSEVICLPPAEEDIFAPPEVSSEKLSLLLYDGKHPNEGRKCELCNVICVSVIGLYQHVMGDKLKKRLKLNAPEQWEQLNRLQYFLDTHLKEDPILGLQYIVEEQQNSAFYMYTCELCDVNSKLQEMIHHVRDVKHVERYIEKHHSDLMLRAHTYPRRALYVIALTKVAVVIHRKYGRGRIQRKITHISGSTPAKVDTQSKAFEIQEYYGSKPVPTTEGDDICLAPAEEDIFAPPKVSSKKDSLALYDGKGANDERTCDLCNVMCPSVENLYQHVIGNKHRKKLQLSAPEQLEQLSRLQYFLDTYLKEDPIFGLQYIEEEQQNSSCYRYTCQLCDVKSNMQQMITHVRSVDHVERYIEKHHSEVSLQTYTYHQRGDYVDALSNVAFTIYKKHGRRSVQCRTADISSVTPAKGDTPSSVDSGKKSGALPPTGVDRKLVYSCSTCSTFCKSREQLCFHFMGSLHRNRLSIIAPEMVKELGRLQYFLDNFLKEEPLLGLEYIVEREIASASYKYKCQLCNVEGDLLQTVTHVTDLDHVASYIKRHYSVLFPKYSHGDDYVRALTAAAWQVHEFYGRKEIQCKIPAISDSSVAKVVSAKDSDKKEGASPASKTNEVYSCCLCKVICQSTVQLYDHVMGNKHRKNLGSSAPEEVKKLARLQYFLDTHLKDEPTLGLEYIVEEQLLLQCRYTCRMCNVQASIREMLLHIAGVDHIEAYVERHHSNLIHSLDDTPAPSYFVKIAYEIHKKSGRKRVAPQNTIIDGSTPAKVAKLSLEEVRKM